MQEMSIRDMILFPIQLRDVIITKMNISNKIGMSKANVENKTKVAWKGETIDSKSGYTFVKLDILGQQNGEIVYNIELEIRGFCQINENNDFDENTFAIFLETRATQLLWPYVREILPSTMIKMGVDPMPVPTIDVLETLLQKSGVENGSN